MADTNKQLVLVVDVNAAMSPYWCTIVSDYLHKIIRLFCGNEAMVSVSTNVELGLVVFNAHESSSLQRYGLTRDVEELFYWLTFITFSSDTGGFNASIAEGLTEALKLFGSTNVSQNGHCILVAASNPNPPVYEQLDKSERQSEKCLSDAETVAKSFSESGVSLSVICPTHYPILKEIYNAGKRNPAAGDHTIDTGENTQYLVLISENLMKDCADLSQSGIITVLQNPSSAQDPVNWKTVSVGNNHPESVQAVGPSNQTFEHVTSGSKNANILNKLSSQVRFIIPTGISTVGGINLGMHTSNMISEGPTYPVSWSSIMSQPLDGYLEAQHLVQNIPATGTMMSHEQVQLQSSQSTYVTVWEGELIYLKEDQLVFITRLQGYQISISSNLLVEEWPRTMLIDRIVSDDLMTNNQHINKADLLVFRSMDQHGLLNHLQENKLCAIIQLPSQVLLLAVSDQPCELIGMLLPKSMMVLEPPSQQQQQGGVTF